MNKEFDKYIKEFLDYLLYTSNYSEHTIKSYKNDLKQFKKFLALTHNQTEESFNIKIEEIDLPRPRTRKALLAHPDYYKYRESLLTFLAECEHTH